MLLEEKFLEFHRYASSHNLPLEAISVGDEKRVLSDEVLEELNEKLNIISANIGTEQLVDITYFVQDERKAGGEYVTHSGIVKRIDLYRRAVIMADETIIPIEDISQIESNLFSGLE